MQEIDSIQSNIDYTLKDSKYFVGARVRFVDDLPENPSARLLEIGCGAGNTAAYALAKKKCGYSCGVELCAGPAEEAAKKMDRVIKGDIEEITLSFSPQSFDILILSEVLEHLRDPARVLVNLRQWLKPGAIVMAGSPNVCHFRVVGMLLKGRWDYQRQGVMDATHLRWFSPATYRELFESAGYVVDWVKDAGLLTPKVRGFNLLTLGRLTYLTQKQIYLRGHRP